MARFRKKPVVIEAVQITEAMVNRYLDGREELPAGLEFGASDRDPSGKITYLRLWAATLEGPMNGSLGDWFITGVKGEHYFCKPDVFEATYEAAE